MSRPQTSQITPNFLPSIPTTMYQIFGHSQTPNKSIPIPASWHYLHTGLKQNLDRVVQYYRDNPMAVASDHILIRLLQSLNIPLGLPLDRYMANVENIALNLSMALKLTSAIYRGQFFDGMFYGSNHELLIANDSSFNIDDAHRNWEKLSPVTVLRNNVSNLDLKLPDGSVTNQNGGISVVLINIPKLALQYRAWMLREMDIAERTGMGMRPVTMFIHGYVLPNMMGTHLDQVIFNRLWLRAKGESPDDHSIHAHPFYMTDYSTKLDDFQEELLVQLQRAQQMNFGEMLTAIPEVFRTNLAEAMHIPDMPATFQLMWALSIARLPALEFLFEMAPGGPLQKNRAIVGKILNDIRNYRRNSIMKTLPPEMQAQIDREMNFLVDQSGQDANLVTNPPLTSV
jgi:hypothetical protein